MLDVERLSVRFGEAYAVREASLSVAPGERVGIVGESGCGKSVLAASLLGLEPEAARVSGSIRLSGTELAGAPERRWRSHRGRDIAMVFQEPMSALNPLLRIGQILAEPIVLHQRLGRRAAEGRVLSLLEEVGLPDARARLSQFPHELSGGQRQRVLIALALAADPSILIADEPTTALDANMAVRIVDLLVDLTRRRGMGLVFISHDLGAVARATERVIVMYGGDIVETGPTRRTLDAPCHPYTAGLIAARPSIARAGAPRMRLPTIPGTVPPVGRRAPGCPFSGRCAVELPICGIERPPMLDLGEGARAACHRLAEADLRDDPATAPAPGAMPETVG
ncbi:MAG: ABC transporter ATP-binding protein [Mesorhizobium sp.]